MREAVDLLRKEINPINGTLYLSRTATEALLKALDTMVELLEHYPVLIKTLEAERKLQLD